MNGSSISSPRAARVRRSTRSVYGMCAYVNRRGFERSHICALSVERSLRRKVRITFTASTRTAGAPSPSIASSTASGCAMNMLRSCSSQARPARRPRSWRAGGVEGGLVEAKVSRRVHYAHIKHNWDVRSVTMLGDGDPAVRVEAKDVIWTVRQRPFNRQRAVQSHCG